MKSEKNLIIVFLYITRDKSGEVKVGKSEEIT